MICGNSISIGSSRPKRIVSRLWPASGLLYDLWLADTGITIVSGGVDTWKGALGALTMSAPISGGTRPTIGAGWDGNRATVTFNGTDARLSCSTLDTRFNGNDTAISVIVAYRILSTPATAGTVFIVGQPGSTADTALRVDYTSPTNSYLNRFVGGTPVSVSRTGLPAGSLVVSYRLRSDGYLVINESSTVNTVNAGALGVLANQSAFCLGDLLQPTAVYPANIAVRAVALGGAMTDTETLATIASWSRIL
jgi:hypothetical protein